MLKYENVAKQIEHYIKVNNLEQGDKLPSLDQLTEEFSVSKSTIIKALDVLEIKGLIYQVRGSGIFVRQAQRPGFINLSGGQGFSNDMEGIQLEGNVISLEVIKPSKKIAKSLMLEEDEDVYYLKRVRSMEGLAFCIEESYYSKKHVIYLNEELAKGSIFEYLQNDLKLSFGFADIYFKISELDKEEAPLLDLKEKDATLLTESLYYLHNGEPYNFSVLKYHKDHVQFFVPSSRY